MVRSACFQKPSILKWKVHFVVLNLSTEQISEKREKRYRLSWNAAAIDRTLHSGKHDKLTSEVKFSLNSKQRQRD